MTPWYITLITGIGSLILGMVIMTIWEKSKKWPFTLELAREHSYYAIINPTAILSLDLIPHNHKTLHLEKIIPSEYMPKSLKVKCCQRKREIFNELLVENMSERGILCGSNLAMLKKKPLHLEIKNLSNLNQQIRLNVLYKGKEELLIIEVPTASSCMK